jgi:hypothetical protein
VGGQLNAGALSFGIDASFTEGNPSTNTYSYRLNGGARVDSAGQSNVADPASKTVGVSALDGNDSVIVYATHVDDAGHWVSDTSGAYYVKPYAPAAPTLSNVTYKSIDVSVNKHASEVAGLYYSVRMDSAGSYWWVQADGGRGSDTIWNTVSGWGTKTVDNLAMATKYVFRAMSRHAFNPAVLSDDVGQQRAEYYGPWRDSES